MSKRITTIALFSALSIIFGYIESLFPIPIAIPGIKLGLSNIVLLLAVYRLSKADTYFLMFIKVFVTSLLFAGLNTLFYSLLGGIFSISAMLLIKKLPFSIIGVSIIGAVFHNIGQITAASIVLQSFSALYYLPILMVAGVIVGIIIGIITQIVLTKIKRS